MVRMTPVTCLSLDYGHPRQTNKQEHLLESPVECGWMCTSCNRMAMGRLITNSHHSSLPENLNDHAADRARRCWAVAFNRASGGCLGEEVQWILPAKQKTVKHVQNSVHIYRIIISWIQRAHLCSVQKNENQHKTQELTIWGKVDHSFSPVVLSNSC